MYLIIALTIGEQVRCNILEVGPTESQVVEDQNVECKKGMLVVLVGGIMFDGT